MVAVAMNVNIPPHPPTPQNPANKHKDDKHTEAEKNEDSTRPLNSVDTINIPEREGTKASKGGTCVTIFCQQSEAGAGKAASVDLTCKQGNVHVCVCVCESGF